MSSIPIERKGENCDEFFILNPGNKFDENLIGKYMIYRYEPEEIRDNIPIYKKFEKEILVDKEILQIIFGLTLSYRRIMVLRWKEIMGFLKDDPEFDISKNFDLKNIRNKVDSTEKLVNHDRELISALNHLENFLKKIYDNIPIPVYTRKLLPSSTATSIICVTEFDCVFDEEYVGMYVLHNKSHDSDLQKKIFEKFNKEYLNTEFTLQLLFKKLNADMRINYCNTWKTILTGMTGYKNFNIKNDLVLDVKQSKKYMKQLSVTKNYSDETKRKMDIAYRHLDSVLKTINNLKKLAADLEFDDAIAECEKAYLENLEPSERKFGESLKELARDFSLKYSENDLDQLLSNYSKQICKAYLKCNK
ncbi:uncharacterized protein KGF55_004796 [Candida pseudojiufengensis]|uniref:uncharacterized protein n=1 Tax=Candida pseudojiufengensis TaxID=497109 RepID=UPI0022253F55|nr:uncharacterized protein KGF55_004796 [Candida pseudojiufengensis]KAI5960073.1 hypothetical protein KGF55_004796 [Candida pseudojiufengensis]